MRILKIALLLLGVYILVATIRTVGFGNLYEEISGLKWQLIPLLSIYPFIFLFDTIGWAYSFPHRLPKNVPFYDLYIIRVVGETLNAIIPWSASLGGEPMKAQLLKQKYGVPLADGYASILIVHTTFWVSLNMFVIGALLATFKEMPLSPILWHSVLAFLIGLGFLAILLVGGLHLGIFKNVHKLGETMKWWGESSGEKKLKFLQLDEEIGKFYTKNPRRFLLSVFFNFLGWFTGTFEVFFIANLLGMNITITEAWLLEALIQVLRIVTFFIPSSIGAQEGGIVFLFLQFGFDKSTGLTFAIIRRLREIIWIAIGMLLWTFMEDRPKLQASTK